MENINYIQKFKQLGFKENESKVFMALLTGDQMSASEIAKKASIRRTDVYEILKNFVEKEYINKIKTSSAIKFRVIEPKIISEKIQNDARVNANKIIHKTKNLFDNLFSLYKVEKLENSKDENIELIRGYNRFRTSRFLELIDSSKEEILMLIRLEGHISKSTDEVVTRFFNRKGIYKSVYEVNLNFKMQVEGSRASINLIDFIELCKFFEKEGEKIKLTKIPISNFTVFDREIIYLNIVNESKPKHGKTDVIIKNKNLAQFLAHLFDLFWTQSFTIEEFCKISNIESVTKINQEIDN